MQSLSAFSLFSELDETHIQALDQRCTWRSYEPNELVIDFEEDTRDVRFLTVGWVRIILRIATGKEMILTEMKDGEFFGEIAAIDNHSRSANVTALSKCQLCIMPQNVFLELLDSHRSVNRSVMSILASRVRSLNTRLAEHSFLQTKHRLYCELLRLSKPRMGHEGQRSISPPPTQKELASRIGTRREVVSREIANMKRSGVLDKTTGALVLTDVAKLNAMISAGWAEAE
ncbi:Crp/Fnr family transcriptional regulator [Pseudahrensia aquimaris]|uniref:Crp/Fnr family transcriptional regulator n=1 Tax=Pseudahrensia aquimaris TaxID=744461 RepID=A0ABW3FGY9_9HYPH